MMWQKAKILRSPEPRAVNRVVWVHAHAPEMIASRGLFYGGYMAPKPMYGTNLVIHGGRGSVVAADGVELLCEFAEHVPLIAWDEFLRGEP